MSNMAWFSSLIQLEKEWQKFVSLMLVYDYSERFKKQMKQLYILASILFLLLCLSGAFLFRETSVLALSGLSLSMQNTFDTRACAANSNGSNCDGQYPVTIQAKPGVGSGVCIDDRTKKFPQVLKDANNNLTAEVDLYWSPTCQTYFAQATSFQGKATITVKVVEHSGISYTVDGTQFEYFNSEESSGPIHGSDGWSPMKWSPTGHVSAEATFDGQNYSAVLDTPQYVGGVQQ